MKFKVDEISSVITEEIRNYRSEVDLAEVGRVLEVGDGIARIWGLEDVMMSELIQFPGDIIGMVLNLEEDSVGAAIFGDVPMHPTKRFGDVADQHIHLHVGQETVVR